MSIDGQIPKREDTFLNMDHYHQFVGQYHYLKDKFSLIIESPAYSSKKFRF